MGQLVGDVSAALRVGAAMITSAILPRAAWRPLTHLIGRAAVALRPQWRSAQLAQLDRRLGPDPHADRRGVLVDRIAYGHEARLHGLRDYLPGSRQRQIRVRGAEEILSTLSEGNGVILWVAPFVFASLMTKVGLHQADFEVSHLSRNAHGFSPSPRAMRWLNPIWTRIEARYLRERIVMSPGDQTAALRLLRARLAENQVVSIAVGDEGAKTVTVPFLASELRVATGPLSLAQKSGAPLLPTFTVLAENGDFEVEVQKALYLDGEEPKADRIANAAAQYASRLAPFVERHTGQWLD
jgi:lauroyl/myristoyl acyltransferase